MEGKSGERSVPADARDGRALLGLSLPVEHSHTVGECRQGNLERGTLRVVRSMGIPWRAPFNRGAVVTRAKVPSTVKCFKGRAIPT